MFQFKTSTPEAVGIPSSSISQFIEKLEKHEIPMHSILMMRHGNLITEGYYAPYRADTLHRMFSVSKSFTAIAIGLLAQEGRLSLDDRIIDYFPEKLPVKVHPYIADMTIRHMLMMRSCHAQTTYKNRREEDWVESFFTARPTHPPGKLFHYDTSAAHTLCALVEKLTGKSMLDYLKEKCLNELDFSMDSYMLTDPFGISMGGSGLMATPMDALKFGYLIAKKGLVNDKQLLDPDYLTAATACQTATVMNAPCLSESFGYGYQFWRSAHNGYVCYGMGGQFIMFLPDYDFIMVTTADTQGISGGNQIIYDALYDILLPDISPEPLPENPEVQTVLSDLLKHLTISPLKDPQNLGINNYKMAAISGKTFKLTENQNHFDSFCVTHSSTQPKTGLLTYKNAEGTHLLAFGFGHSVESLFSSQAFRCLTSAVWLDADTLHIKCRLIDTCVGWIQFMLVFGDNDVTIDMNKKVEYLFEEFDGHLYGTLN